MSTKGIVSNFEDADLIDTNIKDGVDIFGVVWSLSSWPNLPSIPWNFLWEEEALYWPNTTFGLNGTVVRANWNFYCFWMNWSATLRWLIIFKVNWITWASSMIYYAPSVLPASSSFSSVYLDWDIIYYNSTSWWVQLNSLTDVVTWWWWTTWTLITNPLVFWWNNYIYWTRIAYRHPYRLLQWLLSIS